MLSGWLAETVLDQPRGRGYLVSMAGLTELFVHMYYELGVTYEFLCGDTTLCGFSWSDVMCNISSLYYWNIWLRNPVW